MVGTRYGHLGGREVTLYVSHFQTCGHDGVLSTLGLWSVQRTGSGLGAAVAQAVLLQNAPPLLILTIPSAIPCLSR